MQNPFSQPFFVIIQRKIPVFGLFQHGYVAGEGGFRIDKFSDGIGEATLFALVTKGVFVAAMRAFTGNITVGQKLMRLLVIILHGSLFNQFSVVIQIFEKFRRRFRRMEKMLAGDGKTVEQCSAEELDIYWNRVKAEEEKA